MKHSMTTYNDADVHGNKVAGAKAYRRDLLDPGNY
jgi:hypothetical protein